MEIIAAGITDPQAKDRKETQAISALIQAGSRRIIDIRGELVLASEIAPCAAQSGQGLCVSVVKQAPKLTLSQLNSHGYIRT